MQKNSSVAGVSDLRDLALSHVELTQLARTCARLLEHRTAAGKEHDFLQDLLPWLVGESGSSLRWEIQAMPNGGANLVGWRGSSSWKTGGGLWLYSHVDTPFTGEPELDHMALGDTEGPDLDVDLEKVVTGHGAIVAKGPAAAAIVAVLALAKALDVAGDDSYVGVILTGGGTHRVLPVPPPAHVPLGLMQGMGRGVRAAIESGWRPDAVINTKAGPSGVMASEPGCVIVQVQVRGEAAPAAIPMGSPGSAVVAAYIALELDRWSEEFAARESDPGSEVAARAVVGCIEAGLPFKPDFQPAIGRVFVYAVVPTQLSVDGVVDELRSSISAKVAERFGADCADRLDLISLGAQPPGVTAEQSRIVRAARKVWSDEFGDGQDQVRAFTGSSDGALLRAEGIETARFGVPSGVFLGGQGGAEALPTESLLLSARMYVDTSLEYLFGGNDGHGPASALRKEDQP